MPSEVDRVEKMLREVLLEKAGELYGDGSTIERLSRLSGGASRETWSFDVMTPAGMPIPLILKRDPVLYQADGSFVTEESPIGVSRATEGALMELAGRAGVPVPAVPFYLEEDERSTSGFIMERLEGEALGLHILREDAYADARPKLAWQCGHAAARLHGISLDELPELDRMGVKEELAYHHDLMSEVDHPYPGFEYGFRWLEERRELAGERQTLVHGDYRNGNVLVDSDGLRGVLDWELAHVGIPLQDLGWMCVRSWRYGYDSKPVGGFGEISELQDGYEAGGGGRPNAEAIRYWEIFGALRWGMLCINMTFKHINGPHASLEQAAIGRRTAETEYDLLRMLD